MRQLWILFMLVMMISVVSPVISITRREVPLTPSDAQSQYILVGGQNGTWFETGQAPRLDKIFLSNYSVVHLNPVSSEGTVWGGGFNGSQVLVSGWGSDDTSLGPYIWLYNGSNVLTEGSLDKYGKASSWSGGDIFAASYNGKDWLLSGMGSNALSSTYYSGGNNHMGLARFDGRNFTDLSTIVPRQQDAILYANSWNGEYWLVGGGYQADGVLFEFNGTTITDLTSVIEESIPSFGSVQTIAWNGVYWLIGGVGFLAEYDGYHFIDLTSELRSVVELCRWCLSVNAVAWNGSSWMLGGGSPIAQVLPSDAWIASYTVAGFMNLSPSLRSYIYLAHNSSILTIAPLSRSWIFGGYSRSGSVLFSYADGSFVDHSSVTSDMTYINWVSGVVTTRARSVIIAGPYIEYSLPVTLARNLRCREVNISNRINLSGDSGVFRRLTI